MRNHKWDLGLQSKSIRFESGKKYYIANFLILHPEHPTKQHIKSPHDSAVRVYEKNADFYSPCFYIGRGTVVQSKVTLDVR